MKKFFKFLLYLIIALIVLTAIGLFAAMTFINPNRYKDEISSSFQKNTGRELAINGPIELSFFPWLGVRVHQVQMGNPPEFQSQKAFLQVGEADVKVKLMPLFSKRIEVGTVGLKDVTLNLVKDKQGHTNFDDLLKKGVVAQQISSKETVIKTSQDTTTGNTQQTSSVQTQDKTLSNLPVSKSTGFKEITLAGVTIDNMNVNWDNQQTNQQIQISNLHLNAEDISGDKPFKLKLQYDLQDNQSTVAGHFSFNGQAHFNRQENSLTLENLRFAAKLSGKKLPELAFTGNKLVIYLTPKTATLTEGAIQAGNLKAQINLQVATTKNSVSYSGHINLPEFNLKDFLRSIDKPLVTADPTALQRISLSADLSGTAKSLQLSNMQGRVDDSAWQGNINLSDISKWVASVNLGINQLNVDRYLPPRNAAATDAKPTTPVTTVATSQQKPTNYAFLRKATVTGALRINALTVANTNLNQVYARFSLNNGVAQISPLQANVYQGTSQGQIQADFRTSSPRYTLDETLNNIQINQLTRSNKLTGTADVKTHLTLQGDNKETMLRSLNGSTQLNVKNGALLGVDVPYELQRIKALVRKEPIPAKPSDNKTDFGVFNASGVFKNGVFSNNDLLIESDQFKITGHGTANLVTQGLDYHLNASGKQAGAVLEGNLQIPIQVTGTFSKPIITPDLQALAAELLKGRAGEKLQERLMGAPEGGAHPIIRERAGQFLKQFLQ